MHCVLFYNSCNFLVLFFFFLFLSCWCLGHHHIPKLILPYTIVKYRTKTWRCSNQTQITSLVLYLTQKGKLVLGWRILAFRVKLIFLLQVFLLFQRWLRNLLDFLWDGHFVATNHAINKPSALIQAVDLPNKKKKS